METRRVQRRLLLQVSGMGFDRVYFPRELGSLVIVVLWRSVGSKVLHADNGRVPVPGTCANREGKESLQKAAG